MYVACHMEEQSWVLSVHRRSGFVVVMRITSAASNIPETENPPAEEETVMESD